MICNAFSALITLRKLHRLILMEVGINFKIGMDSKRNPSPLDVLQFLYDIVCIKSCVVARKNVRYLLHLASFLVHGSH